MRDKDPEIVPSIVVRPTIKKAPAFVPGLVVRHGRHWRTEEDTLLRQLVEAGLPDEVSANRLKRDVDSVVVRRRVLGLVRPARPSVLPAEILEQIAAMKKRGLTGGVIARLTKIPVHRVAAATTRLRKAGML